MESLAFLHLLQVFDSQFPVGGIETYAQLRFDADSLRELIANQIRFGWGRLDLAAGSLAWRSPADHETLESLAAELHAYKIIPRGGLGRKTSRPSPHLQIAVQEIHDLIRRSFHRGLTSAELS